MTSPGPRADSATAYDASDGYVVLFGGEQQGGGPQGGGLLYDTWTFHAGQWTQLSLRVHPGVDFGSAISYDPVIQRVILFGGTGAGNQTWQFHAGNWTRLHPATSPANLRLARMTYFAPAQELLLYGGCNGTGGGCSPILNNTWAFDHGTWKQLFPAHDPGPRYWFSFSYDPSIKAAVLFGGYNATYIQADTWLYHNGNWTRFCQACGPAAQTISVSVFDPAANAVVLFGGSGAHGFSNQTWEFR
jgi:hypothetical protein